MSETLKDAAIAFFSLALVSGILGMRAEHAVTHDLSRTLRGGELHAAVESRGVFGLLVGEASAVRVTGRGFTANDLPFRITPGDGLRARARHLVIDFRDITLKSLPVRRLYADVPRVTLDAGRAFFDERLIVRSAGEGLAEASVDIDGLQTFIARKYPMFSDVHVTLADNGVGLSGRMEYFGVPSDIEAAGNLQVSQGRYVNVVNARLRMNGEAADSVFTDTVLQMVNPVLDIDRDLGLGSYLTLTDVSVGINSVTLRGRLRIPPLEKR